MEHALDNPVWNALLTGNQALALGDELARVLPRDVGAFAGLADYSPRAFARLHELVPAGALAILFTAEPIVLPAGWQPRLHRELLQLVYDLPTAPAVDSSQLVALQEPDVPAMVALTALTNPGPFLARTIAFGGYYGVFQEGQLVAMAGQRLQPSPYTEISAVCTHPAYLGRGYANQLVRFQVGRIIAAGCTPFLHVYEDNTPAYPLYLKLGFRLRKRLHVYVLEQQPA
ncbi:GNAT family N-acetyltransferase [Hymenobacter sp. 15J16-1T3B]|uniref:GNAT family N-acetyltransferase n=1 Tax=Hymenobacter sp. 15J16-1T3B TaxID=2886941 RepID=UPI001D130639|nr:GNAT family N-acetyltransferase [Hymenobacter sp. 15J16-1T3B]MCC3158235.1 GNAT family N-acetyltransferase [Hymenobacter sp. 15J16-1T3B]